LRKIRNFIVLLLVAGLAWTAWAAGAFYDLTVGLHDGDPVALERRIDWTSVRQALREDLQSGPVISTRGRTIDALLSTPAIANLLRTAKLDDRGWETVALPVANGSLAFNWQRIRYAFYTGSPFSFRVDVRPDSDTLTTPLVLLFRWTGDWRLVRVFLPAPALPTLASAPPSAPAPPLPPGAHRAALYEQVSSDQQGKRYSGSVIWRAEQASSTAGGAPAFTVTAQVTVPDRPLNMTRAIRRNLDPSLPASHMMEINFGLPQDSATGGISDAVGVMMKPDEEAPGQHLVGSRVKVRDGFFMLGLSAVDIDVRHNMDVLRNRPWFGIPIRYKNGSRAVLMIEKGETGDKVFADAFTRWNAPAGASAQKK
jgi:hypothetical protein